jgi:hypothetical protein
MRPTTSKTMLRLNAPVRCGFHKFRSSCWGSVSAARRAGQIHAPIPAAKTSIAAPVSVSGSRGSTPNTRPRMSPAPSQPDKAPARTPNPVTVAPLLSTDHIMRAGVAPSAARTASSYLPSTTIRPSATATPTRAIVSASTAMQEETMARSSRSPSERWSTSFIRRMGMSGRRSSACLRALRNAAAAAIGSPCVLAARYNAPAGSSFHRTYAAGPARTSIPAYFTSETIPTTVARSFR